MHIAFRITAPESTFSTWLQHQTRNVAQTHYPAGQIQFRLQPAREVRGPAGNLQLLMYATVVVKSKTGESRERSTTEPLIAFEIAPLPNDRIEVRADCVDDTTALFGFFLDLIYMISVKWPESTPELQPLLLRRNAELVIRGVREFIQNWDQQKRSDSRRCHYEVRSVHPGFFDLYRDGYRIADIQYAGGIYYSLQQYHGGGVIELVDLHIRGELAFIPQLEVHLQRKLGLQPMSPQQPVQPSDKIPDPEPAQTSAPPASLRPTRSDGQVGGNMPAPSSAVQTDAPIEPAPEADTVSPLNIPPGPLRERRLKVLHLSKEGMSERDIAATLANSHAIGDIERELTTVRNDKRWLRDKGYLSK